MMNDFNKKSDKAKDLWDLCVKEYESKNPIKKILFKRYFETLKNFLRALKDSDRVLEVGCGAGESSIRIKEFLLENIYFEASDVEDSYISTMRERGVPFGVSQESVYQLKREDNSFDCVIMLSVLEHLEKPEAALKELFRVSRKYVILAVPDEPLWSILNLVRLSYLSDWGNTPGHIHRWSKKGITVLVGKFGRVIKIKRSLPWVLVLAEVNPVRNSADSIVSNQ